MAEPVKPKIPEVVDISKADPDRQALYGEAAKVFNEERKKLASGSAYFVPGSTETVPPEQEPAEPEKPKEPEVAEEDKRAFVRSILADRTFEKVYSLFGGQVEAVFVDRTSEETDLLFAQLESTEDDQKWAAQADLLCLGSTLRELKRTNGRNTFPPTQDFAARCADLKKTLSRPLYEALLETARDFEALMNLLISKARTSDFWPAGGASSPSRRTAGAQ